MIQSLNLRQKLLNQVIKFVIIQMHIFFLTGDIAIAITAIGFNANAAFKDCAPFIRCVTHIND